MNDMRVELAKLLHSEGAWCGECEFRGWESCPDCRSSCLGFADAVLAAGYTKPRTVSTGTRTSLVDSMLAYKGTPRHKLFEYPHRDDDSRRMIQEAEQVVTAFLAVLFEPTP